MSLRASTLLVSPHVITEIIDGEAVLLDMKAELYFGLNPIGARIWSGLKHGNSLSAIEAELVDAFPTTPRELIAGDIDALLISLVERGLLLQKA